MFTMRHNSAYSARFSDLTAWHFSSRPRWFWKIIAWLRSWVKTATVQGVILTESLGEHANGSTYTSLVTETICDAIEEYLSTSHEMLPGSLLSQTIQQTNQLLQDEIKAQEMQVQSSAEHEIKVMVTVAWIQSKFQPVPSSFWQRMSKWWLIKQSYIINVWTKNKEWAKKLLSRMKLNLGKKTSAAPEQNKPSSHASDKQATNRADSSEQNILYVVHVGRSRAYLIQDQQAYLLTVDHTRTQELYAAKRLEKAAMHRHPGQTNVRRYLGRQDKAQALTVDTQLLDPVGSAVQREYLAPFIHLKPTDTILLCASGISDILNDEELQDIVAEYPPPVAAFSLRRLARLKGGRSRNYLTVTLSQRWSIKQWLWNIWQFIVSLLDPKLMGSGSKLKTGIFFIINFLLVAVVICLLVVTMLWSINNFFLPEKNHRASRQSAQPTAVLVSSAPPTETLSLTATVANTASALSQPAFSPTPTPIIAPRPVALLATTATPVIPQTATPTATLPPLPLIIRLLMPETGANSNDIQEFAWSANQPPPTGMEFQLIFTDVDQPFYAGFGISPSTVDVEKQEPIPLNQLDKDLGDRFEPRTYKWGVCLVNLAPYTITDQCSEGRQFTFIRAESAQARPDE